MDVSRFLAAARVLIVAGKGGVGKTTVVAAVARTAASAGLSTLVVEVEGKSGIGPLFGRKDPLAYHEVVLAASRDGSTPAVRARTLTPDDALVEYLEAHGLSRISRRLARSGALEVVATAVPGIKDVLVLGKVKQLVQIGAADLIVLDAPAAGHAVTFLASPRGLVDAARVGPIRDQAEAVAGLLSDPARCQVLLVTLPEETPVNEVVDTAYRLEDTVGVSLAGVVVNGLYPQLEGLDRDPAEVAREAGVQLDPDQRDAVTEAAAFRLVRQALQAEQLERLASALPLPQIHLPYLFSPEIGPAQVEELAGALATGIAKL